MSTITMIPATVNRYTTAPDSSAIKRKVAAYARVSTGSEEQLTSYTAQISYYTNYIKARDDWEFVRVYTDEGISGCNTRFREGFKQMIQDALAGEIDLIITKSVSRFARNTVDSLTTIRNLQKNNVECYFEKENIWTFDGKGELLLTIMSSISQEESRSISENVTWGKRKSMSDGKVSFAYSRFLGYDKDVNGDLVINPSQAEIVKMIYADFLKGSSPYMIAKNLTKMGIKTVTGKDTWNRQTIYRILTNEKYKGDALLQKEYTVDFLTKKRQKNIGQLPMYYVNAHHEAIISPDTFDMVQQEIARRKQCRAAYSGVSPFSCKIRCGQCGSWYGAKTWHSTDKYRKCVYQCNHKYEGEKCTTPHITEDEIKQLFIDRINQLIEGNSEPTIESICSQNIDTTQLKADMERHTEKMGQISRAAEEALKEMGSVSNADESRKSYEALREEFETEKKKYSEARAKLQEAESRQLHIRAFKRIFANLTEKLTDFDEDLWSALVEYISVYEDGRKTITLRTGNVLE